MASLKSCELRFLGPIIDHCVTSTFQHLAFSPHSLLLHFWPKVYVVFSINVVLQKRALMQKQYWRCSILLRLKQVEKSFQLARTAQAEFFLIMKIVIGLHKCLYYVYCDILSYLVGPGHLLVCSRQFVKVYS